MKCGSKLKQDSISEPIKKAEIGYSHSKVLSIEAAIIYQLGSRYSAQWEYGSIEADQENLVVQSMQVIPHNDCGSIETTQLSQHPWNCAGYSAQWEWAPLNFLKESSRVTATKVIALPSLLWDNNRVRCNKLWLCLSQEEPAETIKFDYCEWYRNLFQKLEF